MAQSELVKRLTAEQRAREQQAAKHNEFMFGLIPNVTNALEMMIQIPPEDIKWIEIDVNDDILIMGLAVRFPADDIPMFVQIFDPSSVEGIDDDVETINQLIRVGLPLSLIERPVEDIIQFFHDLANGHEPDHEEPTSSDEPAIMDTTFDSSELTAEQTQKLLLFQHSMSNHKH